MQQTFRCPECGAEVLSQLSLEEHVSREHMGTTTRTQAPQEKCPSCSLEFPSAESLEVHAKTHHARAPTD